ncbi:MaoC/PaaZ C-terminal domain-containing protein [Aneurinibacillus aneurinilyticus]|jgi:acyl dehydratase|uniref:3-hydroxyacyl-ACP dehydratase n=2 Tax=Aneurinibacillus aneurinilyticus TaxID=1391 RepID=A0A848CUA8_ANEAE|nr:MaoC/PaaZ C-terminal domain-containing protein [Aneurinibacillus aneurinilyticus]ERI06247.1 MaoC-like protein [Aneurinibacillus aneurinilyticus ATCC 12856]MCI1695557.1 3-hydroxyacyl-ACP dehydratase [Aneurinibacillus aneurinilyticus]MED0673988.1 MaoC/PaaZ C-terminal domain-containing protein [Aneurinibacillus aneurinilyticus]MED0706917.1 MaoC/PaaZ C-terminal domain-containing protein [Aneurinibacillus aneurinilyticus]MED0721955.1 MaoC/PaaZ C-terminal domain-containing protein [Aneurinibacill
MEPYLLHNREAEVGTELPALEKPPVTRMQLIKFAGASGDFNPIHTIESVGQEAGLGGVIAHGMLIMGFVGQALTTWVPRASIKKFGVRFSSITRPGDAITVRGELVGKEENAEGIWVKIKVQAVDQKNEVKVKGTCEALLPHV